MGNISIIVRLKSPDPAAMTAMSTFRRIYPETCPDSLERYDYWCFMNPDQGRETVSGIVLRYHDIVNPNKQTWSFIDELSNPSERSDDSMVWVDVLVTDRIDSVSENWTAILRRSSCEVEGVLCSVLWRFGFASGISYDNARKRVQDLTVSNYRDHGLLANPVSQKIDLPATLRI
jgi:hypothetical protein